MSDWRSSRVAISASMVFHVGRDRAGGSIARATTSTASAASATASTAPAASIAIGMPSPPPRTRLATLGRSRKASREGSASSVLHQLLGNQVLLVLLRDGVFSARRYFEVGGGVRKLLQRDAALLAVVVASRLLRRDVEPARAVIRPRKVVGAVRGEQRDGVDAHLVEEGLEALEMLEGVEARRAEEGDLLPVLPLDLQLGHASLDFSVGEPGARSGGSAQWAVGKGAVGKGAVGKGADVRGAGVGASSSASVVASCRPT